MMNRIIIPWRSNFTRDEYITYLKETYGDKYDVDIMSGEFYLRNGEQAKYIELNGVRVTVRWVGYGVGDNG